MGRIRYIFLSLGILLLVPAAVLTVMGFRWIEAEETRLATEAREQAETERDRARRQLEERQQQALNRGQKAVERVRAQVEEELATLLRQEGARPWFHWNPVYTPEEALASNFFQQASPLAVAPPNPLVAGYFQVDAAGQLTSPVTQAEQYKEGYSYFPGPEEQTAYYGSNVRALEKLTPLADDLGRCLPPAPLENTPQQGSQATTPPSDGLWGMDHNGSSVGQALLDVLATEGDLQVTYMNEDLVWGNLNHGQLFETLQGEQQGQEAIQARYQKAQAWNTENRTQGQKARAAERVAVAHTAMVCVALPPAEEQTDAAPLLLAARRVTVGQECFIQGVVLDREALLADVQRRVDEVTSDDVQLALAEEPEGSARWLPVGRAHLSEEPLLYLGYTLAPPLAAVQPPVVPGRASFVSALTGPRLLLYGAAGMIGLITTAGLGFLFVLVQRNLALSRRQTDFVAAVSHELKAPLTGIRALTELMVEGLVTKPEKIAAYHRSILGESERLTRLIHNVLDYSKLEQNQQQLEPAPCDLGQLVKDVARTFDPWMRSRGVTFELEVAEEEPLAFVADRDALTQVLVNLLDNAVKYGAPEGGQVTLRLGSTPEGGAWLEVSDTGNGIPSEHQGRIFDRFYRAPDRSTQQTGGAGLGLSLVAAHVKAHGGRITLQSEVGVGSTFRVELPARLALE